MAVVVLHQQPIVHEIHRSRSIVINVVVASSWIILKSHLGIVEICRVHVGELLVVVMDYTMIMLKSVKVDIAIGIVQFHLLLFCSGIQRVWRYDGCCRRIVAFVLMGTQIAAVRRLQVGFVTEN